MGKKEKRKKDRAAGSVAPQSQAQASHGPLISRRGWKIIGLGIATVLIGFFVLSFTDPRGQNLPSVFSPFLIIGGYALIAFGIVAKDPAQPSNPK